MKHGIVAALVVAGAASRMVGARHAVPLHVTADTAFTARDSALHVLNRLAYGPRPGEVERVAAEGVMRWIDRQLAPDDIDDRQLATRERQVKLLDYDRDELARMFLEARRERRERKREQAAVSGDAMRAGRDGMDGVAAQHAAPLSSAGDSLRSPGDGGPPDPVLQRGRRMALELQNLAVVRAVLSERQLHEVMVDFWTNHFNVFFGKGADRFLTPDYVEQTIRPRAMGTFEDLLVATAKSPAMMFYLDNWQSVASGSPPPFPFSATRRGGRGVRTPVRGGGQGVRRMRRGINENYARELLELHTLGVDGGYTQHDVIEVARIFTGWSIARPQRGAAFEFHEWAHDFGEKRVLGVRFPAGHGMDEGIRLLKLLAEHPATMHHVSRKLCQRLVNDDPPDGCVDDAVAAWQRSHGDIREVLRAIVRGPDFWAAGNVRAKVKTPLEFLASAVRAVGGDPDSTPRLAQVVARLGEPLYLHVAPDGYAEREDAWVNSGALLDRMNAAVALAAGRLPGVTVDLDAVIPATADADSLLAAVNQKILDGAMSENTRAVIRRETAQIADPARARALAVGLALGGPEFQRQ